MSKRITYKAFSPRRISALASNTFTQLMRMKVFYFLLIFAVIVIASSFFFLRFTFEQELKILKDVSLGAMGIFASFFALAATALLIPKDSEDRTLYTILSKPVPRLEYLLGKLLGVVALIFVSLLLMDILFCGVLYLRQQGMLRELENSSAIRINLYGIQQTIAEQGLTWNLQYAVVAIFLKAVVVASITLLLSTLASSSLFTTMCALAVYLIGHAQAEAVKYFLSEAGGAVAKIVSGAISLMFPNFQLFNIVDAVVAGEVVPMEVLMKLGLVTVMYFSIYLILSYFVFSNKEF